MNKPTTLIIFGISGDLAGRYLLPAIKEIRKAKMLPEEFRIIGITRNLANVAHIKQGVRFFEMDTGNLSDYRRLSEFLDSAENTPSKRLFYLSVPPEPARPIVEMLGKSGLSKGDVKILLEKPFGRDLPSAIELVEHVKEHFSEESIYRIDHYLAKEAVQNLIVFRSGNSLFKKTWNSDFIESIDIVASEKIGIEGRVHFYEQTGALRDYVQSHLLQLAALTLMELPERYDFPKVPALRYEALRNLEVKGSKRGQYEGYRDEVKDPTSMIETFVSIRLGSEDPRWKGVPITLTTGKALDERVTEIRIRYKKSADYESNELCIRLQPDAGIEFSIFAKKPGYAWELSEHTLRFNFSEFYKKLPNAYEQVLYSAFNSDHSLFASSEEVLESWKTLDAVQKKWEKEKEDLIIYKKGSSIEDLL